MKKNYIIAKHESNITIKKLSKIFIKDITFVFKQNTKIGERTTSE